MDSTNESMVPVFDVENQTQEALIRSALENAGIDFFIKDRGTLDVFQSSPYIHFSQVRVLAHDVDKAKSIIEDAIGDNP